jgi:hypothetical protein
MVLLRAGDIATKVRALVASTLFLAVSQYLIQKGPVFATAIIAGTV